jgi:hypothetical protein
MGTGHLNASRAVKQFRNGEYDPGGAAVPVIGWDYDMTSNDGDINEYVISQPLRAGSFIAITLTWDREILFSNEGGDPDRFELDDVFSPFSRLTDMDLYLLPIGCKRDQFQDRWLDCLWNIRRAHFLSNS